MAYPKKGSPPAPVRTKYLHVMLSEDEYRNLQVVTSHVGVGVGDFLRPPIFRAVEREIELRQLRPAPPNRSPSAPHRI